MPGDKTTKGAAVHSSSSSPPASDNPAPKRVSQPAVVPRSPLVVASGVNYSVDIAGRPLQILKNVTLHVDAAEVLAIVGPSGSGKTSLLMLLAGLDRPTGGQIVVAGQDLSHLSEDGLAIYRRNTLGIVFQSFYLIPSLTALDNVGLALEITSPQLSRAETKAAAAAALEAVGLGDRVGHRPAALSGGEQQRVGLARAMITRPRLLLADEPTGNLDQETGALVVKLMFDLARQQQTAVLMITHDPSLAARADRVLTMTQGELAAADNGPA